MAGEEVLARKNVQGGDKKTSYQTSNTSSLILQTLTEHLLRAGAGGYRGKYE